MHSIVYASRAARELGQADLRSLLEQARRGNEAAGVTGMLLYTHGSFLQTIEGEEVALDALYARIGVDERHADLRLLAREPVAARAFAGWHMGFDQPLDADLAQELPGFKASTSYPLVNAELVHNATVARTLLKLYARNP